MELHLGAFVAFGATPSKIPIRRKVSNGSANAPVSFGMFYRPRFVDGNSSYLLSLRRLM
jgi:hypothetical protein